MEQCGWCTSLRSPCHEPHPALYCFNIRIECGVVEDPEGDTHASLHAARDAALAKAHEIMAEGDQKGEGRRSWRFEIMDRANRQVLAVAFADALDRKTTNEAEGS
jgi:hypothetical protein